MKYLLIAMCLILGACSTLTEVPDAPKKQTIKVAKGQTAGMLEMFFRAGFCTMEIPENVTPTAEQLDSFGRYCVQ